MITAASDPAPAWVAFAALAVSVLALLVSTAWGVFTWRRTGEVLALVGDIRAPLFQSGHRRPVRAGEVHTVLTITARNRGRTPVEVHRLYLASKDTKRRSTFERTERSADLPVTIEARDRVSYRDDEGVIRTSVVDTDLAGRIVTERGYGAAEEGRGD